MTNVLIIDATGSLAQVVRRELLAETGVKLTLYARRLNRLGKVNSERERVIQEDATDDAVLRSTMVGQDFVYVNLTGNVDQYAGYIVAAMKETGVRRLALSPLWVLWVLSGNHQNPTAMVF